MIDSGYQPNVAVTLTPDTFSESCSFSYSLPVCHTCCSLQCSSCSHSTTHVPVTVNITQPQIENMSLSVTSVAELCDVESESCQISLQVQDYTKQQPIVWRTPRDVLINTAQLVVLVKDQLAHRLLTNIHRALGMKEIGTFTSLLQEIKFAVMRYLDVRSLLALSATCKLMHRLALDRVVWKSLLQRDYWKSRLPPPRTVFLLNKRAKCHLWIEIYKEKYFNRPLLLDSVNDYDYPTIFPASYRYPVTRHPRESLASILVSTHSSDLDYISIGPDICSRSRSRWTRSITRNRGHVAEFRFCM